MEDQYGMADLRQFMSSSRPLFASIHQPQQTDFLSPSHRELAPPPPAPHHHYEMVMPPPGRGFEFLADSSTTTASAITGGASSAGFSGGGMEMEAAGGNGRWPRQETLTLLEIRSRLDSKFKEANQKGPIWDEVSRILCEEHGYQRSGKKCREKFENLYKYYKKTKDGKAGRQDGKHYRFFRQLEALYGETSNSGGGLTSEIQTNFPYNNVGGDQTFFNNNNLDDDSLPSLSNSSDYDTTSSDEQPVDETMTAGKKKRKGRGRWSGKIKEFIDGQMRKLMEKQEAWLEKIMKTIEKKEQERMLREEEWRKQEAYRMEMEQKFWANERAWIKARDAALMEALHRVSSAAGKPETASDDDEDDGNWTENEMTKLAQIRTNNSTAGSCYYFQTDDNGGGGGSYYCPDPQQNDHLITGSGGGAGINDGCFRLLMGGDADSLWENYGLKLSNQGDGEDK